MINASHDQVLSLAGWVIAFNQMFVALEDELPPSSIGDAGEEEAYRLACQVVGLGEDSTLEENFKRPEIVALFATARERAARMLATAAESDESCLMALDSDDEPSAFGLLSASERLVDAANLARSEGDALAWPS